MAYLTFRILSEINANFCLFLLDLSDYAEIHPIIGKNPEKTVNLGKNRSDFHSFLPSNK